MLQVKRLMDDMSALKGATLDLQEFLRPCNYGTDEKEVIELTRRVEHLIEAVSTGITPLLANAQLSSSESSRELIWALRESNVPNKLEDIIRACISVVMQQSCTELVAVKDLRRGTTKKVVVVNDTALDAIYKRLIALQRTRIVIEHETELPDRCDCGEQMEINPEDSQYICPFCGLTKQVDGVIFRDDQTYAQAGSKMRANDYSAMKHLNDWLPKIFGEERANVPQSVIDKVRAYMIRNKLTLDQISNARKMREILRDPDVSETGHNDHTTQIIRRVGGRAPASPTDAERSIIVAKYKIVISHYPTIAGANSNIKYCPYFVFKIIEIFFADNQRMMGALKYIHLQSSKTIEKNDRIFEQIVEKTDPRDGFRVIPTDREKYL